MVAEARRTLPLRMLAGLCVCLGVTAFLAAVVLVALASLTHAINDDLASRVAISCVMFCCGMVGWGGVFRALCEGTAPTWVRHTRFLRTMVWVARADRPLVYWRHIILMGGIGVTGVAAAVIGVVCEL